MTFCSDLIDQSHKTCDCCVEFQAFNVGRNFLDGTVNLHLQFVGNRFFGKDIGQTCNTVKEFLTAFYRTVAPRCCCAVITHE